MYAHKTRNAELFGAFPAAATDLRIRAAQSRPMGAHCINLWGDADFRRGAFALSLFNLGTELTRHFLHAMSSCANADAIHYTSAGTQAVAGETIAAVKAVGAQVVAFQADLTPSAAVEKLFADTAPFVGRPDIAINTVCRVLKESFAEITEAEYDEMAAVTSKTVFFFCPRGASAGTTPARS